MAAIIFTHGFETDKKKLKKRYPAVDTGVQQIVGQFVRNEKVDGVRVPDAPGCLKVRVKNDDNSRGKSAGYRVLYSTLSGGTVLLFAIYEKTKEDKKAAEVRALRNRP